MEQFKFNDDIPIAGFQTTLNDDPFLTISLTIFCSGCKFNCEGCQQPLLQDPKNGEPMNFLQIKSVIDKHINLIESVCFCGGDWIFYPDQLKKVSTYVRTLNLKTILYTGCLYERISNEILECMDIIIDGKFDCKKQQSSFPASKNQRIFVKGKKIDDPSSLPINNL
jgi:anaerobic ribonucleoside-triphosphate reductase activating protein